MAEKREEVIQQLNKEVERLVRVSTCMKIVSKPNIIWHVIYVPFMIHVKGISSSQC